MRITSKTASASSCTALVAVLFGAFVGIGAPLAQAQGSTANGGSGGHGKPTGIPERKSDGTWESLKPAQQKILAPLEKDWDYMLLESRKKWGLIANLYPKMSEQDQARLQSRMTSWSNLSQRDRRVARENYLTSLKFPTDKKVEAWSAYQKLSDEEKQRLAKAEENKKKPTAANAPTLQQHPLTQKPAILPVGHEGSTSAAESNPSPASDQ